MLQIFASGKIPKTIERIAGGKPLRHFGFYLFNTERFLVKRIDYIKLLRILILEVLVKRIDYIKFPVGRMIVRRL